MTHAPRRQSWALAVSIDLSIVSGELVRVMAQEIGLGWVCLIVITGLAILSAALNYLAFSAYGK